MLKTCWDLVILLATFYVAVMVPYNAAFLDQTHQDKPTIVPDVVVEALFFVGELLCVSWLVLTLSVRWTPQHSPKTTIDTKDRRDH